MTYRKIIIPNSYDFGFFISSSMIEAFFDYLDIRYFNYLIIEDTQGFGNKEYYPMRYIHRHLPLKNNSDTSFALDILDVYFYKHTQEKRFVQREYYKVGHFNPEFSGLGRHNGRTVVRINSLNYVNYSILRPEIRKFFAVEYHNILAHDFHNKNGKEIII